MQRIVSSIFLAKKQSFQEERFKLITINKEARDSKASPLLRNIVVALRLRRHGDQQGTDAMIARTLED